MSRRSRDEFVRELWTAGFEFKEDLQHAHLFFRSADGAEVLVPKREHVGSKWASAHLRGVSLSRRSTARFRSPCCNSESFMRLVHGGAMYLRCTVCARTWSKPTRPDLRVVK